MRRRVCFDEDGANLPRIGEKGVIGALVPLARDPDPIRDDDVRLSACEHDIGGLFSGHRNHGKLDAMSFVKPVMDDRVDLPRDRSGC